MDIRSVAAKTAVASVALLSGAGAVAAPLVITTIATPAIASARPSDRGWMNDDVSMQACRQDRPVWDNQYGGRYQDVWYGYDGNNNIQCYGRLWNGGTECWGFPWWRYSVIITQNRGRWDDCGC